MLQKAAIKVNLREPRSKFLEMLETLKILGTSTLYLVHIDNGSESGFLSKKERIEKLAEEVRNLDSKLPPSLSAGTFLLISPKLQKT